MSLLKKKKKYDNGDVYYGYVNAKGEPEGHGTLTYANGDVFEGEWKDGNAHGPGEYRNGPGHPYYVLRADFVNDYMEGNILYQRQNSKCEARVSHGYFDNDGFLQGVDHKNAKLTEYDSASGKDIVYRGSIDKYFQPFGKGRLTTTNGCVMEGTWTKSGEDENGIPLTSMNGKGTVSSEAGSVLSGNFVRNMPEGDIVIRIDTKGEAVYTGKIRLGWGYLYNLQMNGSLENGILWLHKGLEIYDHTGLKNLNYCSLLENLSKAYSIQYERTKADRDLSEAIKYAERAVSLARQLLTDSEVKSGIPAGSLLRQSDIHMTLKEYAKASELIDEAYQFLDDLYGNQGTRNPDILRATSRKAKVLYYLGKYSESLAETEKNLEAYRKYDDVNNPSYFNQLSLKIRNCIQLDKQEEAKITLEYALELGSKLYSGDSEQIPNLVTYRSSLSKS